MPTGMERIPEQTTGKTGQYPRHGLTPIRPVTIGHTLPGKRWNYWHKQNNLARLKTEEVNVGRPVFMANRSMGKISFPGNQLFSR